MRRIPSLPQDIDAQVEWFHDLAATASSGACEAIDIAVRAALESFMEVHLPGHGLPEGTLVDAIKKLRANEISWNRAVMSSMIDADDQFRAGDAERACKTLADFAATCPWTLFAQAARDQSAQYAP
jgi:hypothetical protein